MYMYMHVYIKLCCVLPSALAEAIFLIIQCDVMMLIDEVLCI